MITFLGIAILSRGETTWKVMPLPTQGQLPVSCIHCILQDSDGYMWYGTQGGGLCRDNGFQIDVFNPNNQLASGSSKIVCLAEGQGPHIWIGTQQGLYLLDKTDYSMTAILPNCIGNKYISTIMCEKEDVWVGTDNKILRLDTRGQLRKTYGLSNNTTNRSTQYLLRDAKGRIWATQWGGGLSIYDKDHDQFVAQPWAEKYTINVIREVGKGILLMGTWGHGILRYDTNTGTLTPEKATTGWPDKECVIDMLLNNDKGLLWVTTNDNLYLYQEREGHLNELSTNTFLPPGKKILDGLARDKEGNIWVSGFTPNTFIITAIGENHIERLTIPEIREKTGYTVLPDRSLREGKYLWIWQGRIALALYDTEKGHLTFADWSCSRNIRINRTNGHGIWASDKSTIFAVNQQGEQITRTSPITVPDKEHVLNLQDNGKGSLYVVTRKHLYIYQIGRGTWTEISKLDAEVIDIELDVETDICYLLTNDNRLLLTNRKGITTSCSHTEDKLAAMSIGYDGSIWLASINGYTYRYNSKENKLVAEGKQYNNHYSPVRDIKVDGLGHVWTVFDQQVIEQNPATGAFRRILATDAEVGVDYFYGAEQDDALHLRLNGAGALCNVQSSERLNQQYKDAAIDISSYIIEDTKHYAESKLQQIELQPGSTNITLSLTTHNWIVGENQVFAYRLEGVNSDWQYCATGSNTITFNHLSPGTYDLIVKVTDRNGCWSAGTKLISLVVKTPWYRTWWAFMLYAILLIIAIYGIYRLEKRIRLLSHLIRRRQEVRLDEVELTREDVTAEHLDDTFLHDVMRHIKANLGNADYNVETLAQDMCMSRMNLYRKIKQLTGLTPTALLREVRLKTAAQLLTSRPDVPITDVARRVGFTTSSYFAKSFKEEFGVLPSEFGNKTTQEM